MQGMKMPTLEFQLANFGVAAIHIILYVDRFWPS
jgi:hypothetical protein